MIDSNHKKVIESLFESSRRNALCPLPESGFDLFVLLFGYKLDHDLLFFERATGYKEVCRHTIH
jgi:hypothetical protein